MIKLEMECIDAEDLSQLVDVQCVRNSILANESLLVLKEDPPVVAGTRLPHPT